MANWSLAEWRKLFQLVIQVLCCGNILGLFSITELFWISPRNCLKMSLCQQKAYDGTWLIPQLTTHMPDDVVEHICRDLCKSSASETDLARIFLKAKQRSWKKVWKHTRISASSCVAKQEPIICGIFGFFWIFLLSNILWLVGEQNGKVVQDFSLCLLW